MHWDHAVRLLSYCSSPSRFVSGRELKRACHLAHVLWADMSSISFVDLFGDSMNVVVPRFTVEKWKIIGLFMWDPEASYWCVD